MVYVKKFKAAIINPDRTIDVKYIGPKRKLGANAFYLGKNKKEIDEVYIINPAYTIITTTKRMGIPFRYQTCYYKKNIPVPVPMNEIHGGQTIEQLTDIEDDNGKIVGKEVYVQHPIPIPEFSNMKEYTHITAQEMAVLFNPQFYKMIAKANVNKKDDQMWMMQIGSLAGIGFIIYYMMQSLPKTIVKAISAYLGGG
jgi:hypothetical protein